MAIKKTGRKRYRVHTRLLGAPLMVLQLEYTETGRWEWTNDGNVIECESLPDLTFWKDATLEDITEGRNSEVL